MANIINLEDFGLKTTNTGQQNDLAIASAISRVNTLGGGIIVVPFGLFFISTGIALPPVTSIIGHSDFSSTFKASSSISGAMLRIAGEYGNFRLGHRVENLCLWGNYDVDIGVHVTYAVNSNVFRNLYIKEFKSHGIYMPSDTTEGRKDQGCWGNTIENCYISSNGRGVELGVSGNAVRINNCTIANNRLAGIYTYASTGINIRGNILENNGTDESEPYAVMIYGGGAGIIDGCYFGGNGNGANNSAHIYTDESYWNGLERGSCDGLMLSGNYYFGRDDLTANAISIGQGEVTIFGGYSNRHFGKTIVLRTGGSVNRYGLVSVDSEGII